MILKFAHVMLYLTSICSLSQILAMQLVPSIHKASGLPLELSQLTADDLETLKPVLLKVMAHMDDWPQLNHYRSANDRLLHINANCNRIVFLGDSIFEYWNDPQFGTFFSNTSYINRGIAGQTTPQILLRLRSDAIALKPKVMVLLAGINDIGANTGPITFEETIGNIASIAELASINRIKVIIGTILPTSNYHFDGKDPKGPQTAKRPLEKIRALNEWIKQYALDHNHLFIDFYSAFIDDQGMLRKELSEDDLHPNNAGYAIMAALTKEAITKTLQ